MAKTSAKKYRKSASPQLIQAVQNYILGGTTQEKAMLDAGYAATTAKKQCHKITQHPLYQEYKLAQAEQVKISKDYINLRMLKRLSGKLSFSEELKALDFLATINGYKPKEGGDATPINIWNMLVGGNDDLASEKDLQERYGYLYPGKGRAKTRL